MEALSFALDAQKDSGMIQPQTPALAIKAPLMPGAPISIILIYSIVEKASSSIKETLNAKVSLRSSHIRYLSIRLYWSL